MSIDVIARLQLRAEQFSSETGRAFAEFQDKAGRAAAEMRAPFVASFAEVQKLARQSLDMPRTASGSLNLKGEIGELERSAAAADRRATALRELSVAQTAAASSGQAGTASLHAEADASAVASLAEEKNAAAIRDRIAALRTVQGELDKTRSATEVASDVAARNTRNVGLQRAGYQQLGFQLNDISTSLMGGARPAQVFAQQSSQLFQALQMVAAGAGGAAKAATGAGAASAEAGVDVEGMGEKVTGLAEKASGAGGKLGAMAGVLAGPWGAALTIGAGLLIPFIAKLFEHNDAVGDAVKQLREQAAQERISEQANAAYEQSLDGLIAKTQRLNAEMGKRLATQDQIDQRAVIDAHTDANKSARLLREAIEDQRSASEALARAKQRNDPGLDADTAAVAAEARIAVAARRLKEANQKVSDARVQVTNAQRQIRLARIPVIESEVAASLDGATAATTRYTTALGKLRNEQDRGAITELQYRVRFASLEQARDREVKAAQIAARPADNRQTGREVSLDEARSIVTGIGGHVTPQGGLRSYAQQAAIWADKLAGRHAGPVARPGTSAHERGGALDVAYGPGISLDSLTRAFAAQGVKLTKKLDERQQHVYHIEWATAQADRTARDAAQEAVAATRELDQDLASVVGAFDPARAAAAEYAAELERIAKLSAAGRLSWSEQYDYSMRAAEKFGAARAATMGPPPALNYGGELLPGLRGLEADHASQAAAEARVRDIEEARREQQEGSLRYLAGLYGDLFNGQTRNVMSNLERLGTDTLGRMMSGWTLDLGEKLPAGLKSLLKSGAGEGAALGGLTGSVFSTITGGRQNGAASQLGGVVGDVAGRAIGKTVGSAASGLLKQLGGAAGPIGAIAGSVLGNLVGGLFAKAKTGSAAITGADGSAALSGTDGALRKEAGTLAGSVQKGIASIAAQLGAELGGFNVSIGTYKGTYRVNTAGGATNGKNKGFIDYGEDSEAAVKAAIADAIKDGALVGISAASQAILRSGQDIDKALAKALSIESIPRELQAMLDPVGAALDALNRKWKTTVAALDEGGASAEQRAQAEQLYNRQLDQVKASTVSASQSLKDFLTALKIGSASPYSLRDQEAAARAQLAPYLSAIDAGSGVDQGKYQAAAQSFLDIERQLYGSTQAYFDQLDAIQAATNRAIADIDNAVPISTPVESPFLKAAADNTASTAANTQTGNEIMAQVSDTLADVRSLLSAIAAGGGSDGGFIGEDRLFLKTGSY